MLDSPKRWKRRDRFGWPSLIVAFLFGVGLTVWIAPEAIKDGALDMLDALQARIESFRGNV